MKKVIRAAKGTPEQFLEALENRLEELQASKDLVIESSEEFDPLKIPVLEYLSNKVLEYLRNEGYDVDAEGIKNYADAAAEYIELVRDSDPENSRYSVEDWYKDTKLNYPEELDNLEKIEECYQDDIDECDDIYSNHIEATTEEDKYQFIDWLAIHDQAYQDAEDFFGKNLEEVSWDDLIGWLSEHEVLLDDYMHHFGKSALIDDDLIDAMSEEEVDVYV